MSLKNWLDKNIYGNYSDNWDNTLFSQKISSYIKKDFCVLDLGAGAGIIPQMNFRGKAARVCGIDPDQRVLENPYLDEAIIGFGESVPYSENSFDMVFSTNVLEHLPEPEKVFNEVHRVLKPGGLFLFKTPNKWHYVALIARITPHWFHELINRLRGRDESDTFPTLYKANTPLAIRQFAEKTEFHVKELRLTEGRPEYMRISSITYIPGLIYEKLVNSFCGFEKFRVIIMGVLQK